MDETKFVANFAKSAAEMVFIGVNQWQGKWRCFIRIYYPGPDNEQEWLPTKKGISIELDQFPALKEAMQVLGKDLDTERQVAIIAQRAQQEIRISLDHFKTSKLINIRTYVEIEGELRPTQKGVSLKPDFFPELWDGIEKLGDVIPTLN